MAADIAPSYAFQHAFPLQLDQYALVLQNFYASSILRLQTFKGLALLAKKIRHCIQFTTKIISTGLPGVAEGLNSKIMMTKRKAADI